MWLDSVEAENTVLEVFTTIFRTLKFSILTEAAKKITQIYLSTHLLYYFRIDNIAFYSAASIRLAHHCRPSITTGPGGVAPPL